MRRCDALFFTAVKSQFQWLGSDERSFPENLGVKNWGDAEKNGPHNFQRAKIELLVLQSVTALSELKTKHACLWVSSCYLFLEAPRKMSLGSGVSKGLFHGNLTIPPPKCHLFSWAIRPY